VIVAAFGDPGLAHLRRVLGCPVTGIAEAGMAEAAAGGRPFVVVTTTPGPAASIGEMEKAYGYGDLCRGVCLTCSEAHEVMADPHRFEAGLAAACKQAVRHHDAEAIVIGGGPLAMAAREGSFHHSDHRAGRRAPRDHPRPRPGSERDGLKLNPSHPLS
jgi:Asp/Glu/hydantoin racemase